MTGYILVKYVHLIGIFGIVSSLILEAYLVRKTVSARTILQLAKIDGIYGLSSVIAVAAGLVLWFSVGKPSAFYTENPLFLTKVGLAILLGLLSLPPSLFFWKAKKKSGIVKVPEYVPYLIYIEIAILLCIPMLATMMAQGYHG